MGAGARRVRGSVAAAIAVAALVLGSCAPQPGDGSSGDGGTGGTTPGSPSTTTSTTSTAAPGSPRYELRINGEPGEPISRGRSNAWSNRPPSAFQSSVDRDGLTIRFDPGFGAFWSLKFSAPEGDELIAGPFEAAEGFAFGSPTRPGLSVSGNGLGCGDSSGRFEVLQLELGPSGVEQFAATFSFRCAGAPAGLTGEIHVAATSPFPTPPDGDADGVPDSIDNCRTTVNPIQSDADLDRAGDDCDATVTRTWLSFASDPGDFVGQGIERTWHGVDGTFTIRIPAGSPDSVEVRFDGGLTWWTLRFGLPDGAPLVPGDYPDAVNAFNAPPGVPGLKVSGSGRGCSVIAGSFIVHEVVRGPGGAVERLSADFVQRCDGLPEALRGSVRYDASLP